MDKFPRSSGSRDGYPASPSTIVLSLSSALAPEYPLARASELVDFTSTNDPRGPSVTFSFDSRFLSSKDQLYYLEDRNPGKWLTLSGSAIANETDYDWGLPFRIDGYDAVRRHLSRRSEPCKSIGMITQTKLNRFVEIAQPVRLHRHPNQSSIRADHAPAGTVSADHVLLSRTARLSAGRGYYRML